MPVYKVVLAGDGNVGKTSGPDSRVCPSCRPAPPPVTTWSRCSWGWRIWRRIVPIAPRNNGDQFLQADNDGLAAPLPPYVGTAGRVAFACVMLTIRASYPNNSFIFHQSRAMGLFRLHAGAFLPKM